MWASNRTIIDGLGLGRYSSLSASDMLEMLQLYIANTKSDGLTQHHSPASHIPSRTPTLHMPNHSPTSHMPSHIDPSHLSTGRQDAPFGDADIELPSPMQPRASDRAHCGWSEHSMLRGGSVSGATTFIVTPTSAASTTRSLCLSPDAASTTPRQGTRPHSHAPMHKQGGKHACATRMLARHEHTQAQGSKLAQCCCSLTARSAAHRRDLLCTRHQRRQSALHLSALAWGARHRQHCKA